MKLTYIKVEDKDYKTGNDLSFIGKDGRAVKYKRLTVKVEGNDNWISGMITNPTDPRLNWQNGQEVNFEIDAKKVGDKTFYNMKPVSRLDELEKRVKALEDKLTEPQVDIDQLKF